MWSIKLLIVVVLLKISSSAKLPSSYLPPSAKGAGGGIGLSSPIRPDSGGRGDESRGGGVGGNRYGNGGGGSGGGGGDNGERGGKSGDQIPIISYENVNNGDGSYKWSYETGNGIKAQEEGQLKPGGEEGIQSAIGSYTYTAPDGTEIKIEYTADENGFVPVGEHLPTPPPIPPEILKSLEQNAAEGAARSGGRGTDGRNGGENGGRTGYQY